MRVESEALVLLRERMAELVETVQRMNIGNERTGARRDSAPLMEGASGADGQRAGLLGWILRRFR